MKWRHRPRYDTIERKRDTTWRRNDVGRKRDGQRERDETMPVKLTRILLDRQMKKKSTCSIQLL
jgi:hypothetical protein